MILASDIGGTHIRLGLYQSKQLVKLAKFPLSDDFHESSLKIQATLLEWKQQGLYDELEMAVFAIAGAIAPDARRLANAVNLKDWYGIDLVNEFSKICACPVKIYNDAFCAAFAEAKAERQAFWYVNWGTGIGGCLVSAEDKFIASEIGHMIIDYHGDACRCGQIGCWDALIGGRTLSLKYKKDLADLSEKEWRQAFEIFCIGLCNLYVAYPAKIIINGGVIIAQSDKLPLLKELLKQKLKIFPIQPVIALAKNKDLAGLNGAALLAQS